MTYQIVSSELTRGQYEVRVLLSPSESHFFYFEAPPTQADVDAAADLLLSQRVQPAITTEAPSDDYLSDIQIRKALLDIGLLDTVDNAVKTGGDRSLQIDWDRSLRFFRFDPRIMQMADAISAQIGGTGDGLLTRLWSIGKNKA